MLFFSLPKYESDRSVISLAVVDLIVVTRSAEGAVALKEPDGSS